MIGIPVLDNLSFEDLIRVVNGDIRIRIPEKPPLQLSITDLPEPQLMPQIKEMDNNKIITLCSMEIESRMGWTYLRELLEKNEPTI